MSQVHERVDFLPAGNKLNVMKRRVLFTTKVGSDLHAFQYAMPQQIISLDYRFPSMGLRFLRENVPGIEILEFPTWEQYEDELARGVDVLGISLYTRDIPTVEKMVHLARERYGVKEIWGGNYGVLTPGVEKLFDRIFVGYAEDEVHLALTGRPREGEIRHPLMVTPINAILFPWVRVYMGIVFTYRGCNFKCTFCQTPAFAPKMTPLPRAQLESLVDNYYKMGIRVILFAEESFTPSLNRDLLDRINFYGMKWYSQSRADSLHNRIGHLVKDTGYIGSLVGVESLNERNLELLQKSVSARKLLETLDEARQENVFMQGTYMFGYEHETPRSLEDDAERLLSLPVLVNHYFVLTPYPRTEIYRYVRERFGEPSQNWGLYDSRHLVWNHPHFTPQKMNAFVDKIRTRGWNPAKFVKTAAAMFLKFLPQLRLS